LRRKISRWIAREWKGEVHAVAVTPDGYEYRGEIYKSLSPITNRITGTRDRRSLAPSRKSPRSEPNRDLADHSPRPRVKPDSPFFPSGEFAPNAGLFRDSVALTLPHSSAEIRDLPANPALFPTITGNCQNYEM
jgi:hypothetical protein